jgi:hypothetical protein
VIFRQGHDPGRFGLSDYTDRTALGLFCKLKQFRAIATRYDKIAQNFLAAVYLAASIIWLNSRRPPVNALATPRNPFRAQIGFLTDG